MGMSVGCTNVLPQAAAVCVYVYTYHWCPHDHGMAVWMDICMSDPHSRGFLQQVVTLCWCCKLQSLPC